MRILRVVASMDPAGGGVAEAIRLTTNGLAKMGHHCQVVCMDDPGAPWVRAGEPNITALGCELAAYGYSAKLEPWLRENARSFDIVVVDGLWLFPTRAVARSLSRVGMEYYVMPHGMLDPYFQKASDRRLKAIRNTVYWHLFEKHAVNGAAGVLFTCEQERLLARRSFGGYRPRQEHVIGLGIEQPPEGTALATAAEQVVPGYSNMKALLYLGRLHPKKGIDMLIRAYGELAREGTSDMPPLIIAGPPQSKAGLDELHALAENEALGRDRIHFLGEVRGDLKWALIRGAGAVILPSHQENFGIVVAEAMACGKPALITDKVNIWREIESDGAGLVAPDTDAGIRTLLSRWLSMQEGLQAEMGRAARACFEKRFEISAATAAIADLPGGSSRTK